MDKGRLEAMSDGVFAIVMTLLVFDIKLPDVAGPISNIQLWGILGVLWPSFVSYAFSFLVLSAFWINHHFLFHTFIKSVDRYLNLMNMIYLLFLAFVPFSAHLIGTYPYNQPAAIVYGLNILAVIGMSTAIVRYATKHEELSNTLSSRQLKQGQVRNYLTVTSYLIGLAVSFFFIPASIFFYLFPLIFNIIPGTLNFAEKVFKFELA